MIYSNCQILKSLVNKIQVLKILDVHGNIFIELDHLITRFYHFSNYNYLQIHNIDMQITTKWKLFKFLICVNS